MKNHKMLLVVPALLAVQASFAQGSHLTLSDNHPTASKKISLTYYPAGTAVAGKTDIEAQVYFIDGKDNPVADIDLKPDGAKLNGTFTIPATAKTFFIKVFSADSVDNNNGDGYMYAVYKGQQPVQGAYAGQGFVLMSGIGTNLAKINRSYTRGMELYKKEKEAYPKGELLYRDNYYYMLSTDTSLTAAAMLSADEKTLEKSNDEKDLVLASSILNWKRKKASADSLNDVIKKRFPNGLITQNEASTALYNEQDLNKKDSLYKAFVARFPKEKETPMLDYFRTQLAVGYLQKGDKEGYNKYAAQVKNKISLAGDLNNIVYEWAKKGERLDEAEKLSKQTLDIVTASQKNPAATPYQSPKSVIKASKRSYEMYADTYAFILYKQKNYAEAYKYESPLFPKFADDAETTEHYVLILNALGKYADSKPLIESIVKAGKGSPVLTEELKKDYVNLNGGEKGYDTYLAGLTEAANAKKREELAKQMINEPAAAFELKDFDGNAVSLASLKGKTVIVDFWATWCGPCKASFPGMQLAVNKYKDDPEVKFLFIDTWENGDNYADGVKKFIADNKYTFHVLLDEKNTEGRQAKVVTQFGVNGIPTKFIIDKNGNIRFKVVGYSGSTDGVFNEVSAMIDMLKQPAIAEVATGK